MLSLSTRSEFHIIETCSVVCVCVGGGGGGVCACTKINIQPLISSTFSCGKRYSREDEELRNYRIILGCIRAFLMVSVLIMGRGDVVPHIVSWPIGKRFE